MKLRGFSLIEVAVASAIAGIIGVASISAFAVLNRQMVVVEREAMANDIAKGTVDVLVSSLQGAGGGPVRPHMAVLVTDGNNGAPDVLAVATLIGDAPICTIKTTSDTDNNVAVDNTEPGKCCLTKLFAAAGGTNVEAYLVNGAVHRQVKLTAKFGCKATIDPGAMAALNTPAVPLSTFVGGSIYAVTVKSISLNDETELQETQQTPEGTVTSIISDGVFDFQVQLGFDRVPDGRLVDTLSADDEWQYNMVNDTDTFTRSDLRMIAVGVVVGIRSQTSKVSVAQLVGGEKKRSRDFFLRSAMGRATFRNAFVFN